MKAKGKLKPKPTHDVAVAYVHPNDVQANFFESFVEMMVWDLAHSQRLSHRIGMRCSSGGLVEARNQVVAEFLKGDAEWLLWLDSDMGFAPDTLDQLLAAADRDERPIVGALCFAWKETRQDGLFGFRCVSRPTILNWVEYDNVQTFMGTLEVPDNSLVKCAATGMACVLIHRSVFEAIGEQDWYNRIKGTDGSMLGEDISFCVRAGARGIPVHVHTGVPTNHQKTLWVGPEDWARDCPSDTTDA
jgi:glycosyltransferase involved in cell wall biosynthesis